jgi:hypothetical protein
LKFSRRFDTLGSFALEKDKDAVVKSLEAEVNKITKSINKFPTLSWLEWIIEVPKKNIKSLLGEAPRHNINNSDIVHIGRLTEKEFMESFVNTNIFRPTPEENYTLQFDVTRVAVQQVVGKTNG